MTTIAVPGDVTSTLIALSGAVGGSIILAGGWAVQLRLQLAGGNPRPTEDVDVVLPRHLRPAGAALAAIGAVQIDANHAATQRVGVAG